MRTTKVLSSIYQQNLYLGKCYKKLQERNIFIAQRDQYFCQGGNKKGEHFVVLEAKESLSKNLLKPKSLLKRCFPVACCIIVLVWYSGRACFFQYFR